MNEWYDIIVCEAPVDIDPNDDECVGKVWINAGEIRILSNLLNRPYSNSGLNKILLHEIVHCWLVETGVSNIMANEVIEAVCDCVAYGINDLLENNICDIGEMYGEETDISTEEEEAREET